MLLNECFKYLKWAHLKSNIATFIFSHRGVAIVQLYYMLCYVFIYLLPETVKIHISVLLREWMTLPLSSSSLVPPVRPPPLRSASARRCLCPPSSTTARCPAPATRPGPRATPARRSAVNVAAGQTWLAETAPCAPRATGDSPTADVSVRLSEWMSNIYL